MQRRFENMYRIKFFNYLKLATIFFAFFLFPIFYFLFSPSVYAASNQFNIGVTVVSDLIPPSTPTGLSATTISASQINLAWTASTDNVAVGGYVIRRGGSILATTSAITYSDTGLAASTAFTYTVQAFDTNFNYSGSSSPATATTSAGGGGGGGGGDTTPPTVSSFLPTNGASNVATGTVLQMTMSELVNKVSGNITIKKFSNNSVVEAISVSSSQVTLASTVVSITLSSSLLSNTQYYVEAQAGTFADAAGNNFQGFSGNGVWSFTTINNTPPVISGVAATTTYTTATITFTTDKSAQTTLDWGLSTAYGAGTASEVGFTTSHTLSISGLATNTLYYFRLTSKDAANNTSVPYTGNFTTRNPPPPPDTTPPSNPGSFTGNPGLNDIQLSWTNPTDPDFSAVRIMRRLTGYPVDPTDGVLVYDGNATSFDNTGLATGTRYYYTAFARDLSFNYSSGAIFTAVTDSGIAPPPPPPPPPPAPTPTPPPSPTPTPGSPPPTPGSPSPSPTSPSPSPIVITPPITSTSTGPFVDFPATGTPSTQEKNLTLNDFTFTQLGGSERVLTINNSTVRTNGDLPLRISIATNKLPEVLTTIAISIDDPRGSNPTVSYLLSINKGRKTYEGVIPPFKTTDEYPFTLSILDHERKAITRISGVFDVFFLPKPPSFLPPQIQEAITQALTTVSEPIHIVNTVAAPVGVAVGGAQAVLLATNVTSGYDLYLLLLKLVGLLTGLFRRKRNQPWGVVYDSVTKRPLDPAYVIAQLRGTASSKGEAITDLDGRYGFFLNPGEYEIVANKTHYKFPSEKLKGKARDEFYENLYFGDPFQVRDGGVVQYNIPLDPVEFDWNEYAKNQDKVFMVYSKKQNIRLWIFNIVFFFGLIFSVFSLIITFSILNLTVAAVYFIILAFQIFWRVSHKITRVIDKNTGKPIPFALIKVWLSGINTAVKKSVSDKTGRFYFLVPPGKYFMTVEAKQLDGSYKEVLRTEERELKGGVVKEDFLVNS